MVDKELRRVLTALEEAGYSLHTTRRGHIEVRKDGRRITMFSGTPSDRRAHMNALAPLKREGFTWPPRH